MHTDAPRAIGKNEQKMGNAVPGLRGQGATGSQGGGVKVACPGFGVGCGSSKYTYCFGTESVSHGQYGNAK